MNYVPLYIKTHNSLLSSMIKIDELITKAKELKLNALTITDDNMYGTMDFYKACTKNNIKPIIGLNIKIDDLDIVLYAKDEIGYKNLLKIETINSENNLSFENLNLYKNNLICIMPYTSRKIYNNLKNIFNELFIGYKNKEERSKLKGNNLIYLNEILYLNKNDFKYFKYLIAIKNGTNIDNIDIVNNNNYLLSNEEFEKLYADDFQNNYYIFENCNITLTFNNDLLPVYSCPNNLDSFTYLKELCKEGLKKIFGDSIYKAYIERLKYELDIINKMGFCNYFLVVWDYVKYAKENDILVGPGRGSAAGSLVSYLLNITTVDPIKHNLLFERFLNPERITMPDIDIDFEDIKRDEIIKYCISKYGSKKVAPIITFGTMASKQALRDVGRSMDADSKKVDALCKYIDSNLNLKENYKNNKRFHDLVNLDNINKNIFEVALKFEGLKRHTSMHAAGIVMSKIDLDEVIPLDRSHEEFYVTGYDMTYLEEIGLLKMDFLALKNLTMIKDCLNDIGNNLNFYDIPVDDKEALKIFYDVNTTGIFQFETTGMMNFLRKFKIQKFDDIGVALALFRPGPMENIDTFINRRFGKEKVDYYHEDLVNILKPTYGIIVYQEQIMQIASVMAGYSYGEADLLRRAMSKKKEEILINEKEKFIRQSIERGYEKEVCTKVYDMILKFASYGFNKAHSVSYAYIAAKMAYLKAHYPLQFLKQLLNGSIGSDIKTNEYIYECKKNNIILCKTNINISKEEYIIENNTLVAPLTIIKNLGILGANKIIEEREKNKFKDIFDFVNRTYGKGINKKILENLIDAGALDNFGYNHHTLKENLDIIINYSEIGDLIDDDSLKPEIKIYEEYNTQELLAFEKEAYGFYLTRHPVMDLKLKYENIINLDQINNYFDKNINVIIYAEKIKEIGTKNNDKMAFIDASDEVSKIDIVLFPKTYQKYKDIKNGKIYLIKGRVEKRFDKYQLNAFELTELELK